MRQDQIGSPNDAWWRRLFLKSPTVWVAAPQPEQHGLAVICPDGRTGIPRLPSSDDPVSQPFDHPYTSLKLAEIGFLSMHGPKDFPGQFRGMDASSQAEYKDTRPTSAVIIYIDVSCVACFLSAIRLNFDANGFSPCRSRAVGAPLASLAVAAHISDAAERFLQLLPGVGRGFKRQFHVISSDARYLWWPVDNIVTARSF